MHQENNGTGKQWHSLFYTEAIAWLWLEAEALRSAQILLFQCYERKCQRPRTRAVLGGEAGGGVWDVSHKRKLP